VEEERDYRRDRSVRSGLPLKSGRNARDKSKKRMPSRFKGKRAKSQILGSRPLVSGRSRRKSPMAARKGTRKVEKRHVRKGKELERARPKSQLRRSIVVLNEEDEFEDIESYISKQKQKMKKLEELKVRKQELEEIICKGYQEDCGDGEEGDDDSNGENLDLNNIEYTEKFLQEKLKNCGKSLKKSKPRNKSSKVLNKRVKMMTTKTKRRPKRRQNSSSNYSNILKERKNSRIQSILNSSNSDCAELSHSSSDVYKEHTIEFNHNERPRALKKVKGKKSRKTSFVQNNSECASNKDFIVINNEKIYFEQHTVDNLIKINRPSRLLKHKQINPDYL
jgi:hypothetical protein